mgnify:CR=1 FL=1
MKQGTLAHLPALKRKGPGNHSLSLDRLNRPGRRYLGIDQTNQVRLQRQLIDNQYALILRNQFDTATVGFAVNKNGLGR